MALSYVGTGTSTGSGGIATFTLWASVPAGVQAGDYALLTYNVGACGPSVIQRSVNGVTGLDAGWTVLVDQRVDDLPSLDGHAGNGLTVWGKVLTAADLPAAGSTPTRYIVRAGPGDGNASVPGATVGITVYRGVSATVPVRSASGRLNDAAPSAVNTAVGTAGMPAYSGGPTERDYVDSPPVGIQTGDWLVTIVGSVGGSGQGAASYGATTATSILKAGTVPGAVVREDRTNGNNSAVGLLTEPIGVDGTAAGHRVGLAVASSGRRAAASIVLASANQPPGSPTLLEPVGNAPVALTVTNRLRWQPNDPNAGDTQSQADVRWRTVGASSWTTVTVAGPNGYLDVAAGTFTAGPFEWQVRTADRLGAVGPWSGSDYFTAATPPAAPVFTVPTAGQVLTDPTGGTVAWVIAAQDAYQLRAVGDSAGSPDATLVLYDSGTVEQPAARSAVVPRPVNGRTEHTQVRVRTAGLWGAWGSVRNTVQYTEPPTPNVALTGTAVGVRVVLSAAAPVGSQPTIAYCDVWRRPTGSSTVLRVAAGVPLGALVDTTVGSGIDYEYQARAVGGNTATAASTWTGSTVVVPAPTTGAGAYGAGAYSEGAYGE